MGAGTVFERFTTGRKIKGHASAIRERLRESDSDKYVTTPLLGCEAIGKVSGLPLMSWVYCNPLGPTLWALCSAEVPGGEDHLLTLLMDNPFKYQRAVFGLIPD